MHSTHAIWSPSADWCTTKPKNKRLKKWGEYFISLSRTWLLGVGFQIQEDLLHQYCTLKVPHGARVKPQMTKEECKKGKVVANLRIHVEQAVNRLKTFRISKKYFSHN